MRAAPFLALLAIAIAPCAASANHAADAAREALMHAHHKMMADMQRVAPTGDADRDFVEMMIPHHQGAIDAAKVELRYGHDQQLRALAEEIIAAQEKEILELRAWLAANP